MKNIIFFDISNYDKIIQGVIFKKQSSLFNIFHQANVSNSLVKVNGILKLKQEDKKKENFLNLERYEIHLERMKIINESKSFPIDIYLTNRRFKDKYLKYRYLFLRNAEFKNFLLIKCRFLSWIRSFFQKNNFIEIETPLLSKSYPEGANEFLVFSRGKAKYTLAQSPQIFKQMLIMAGFEKYYQIAKCFRDENLRSDRQPEFLQLDLEMNFITEKEIFLFCEKLINFLFKKLIISNVSDLKQNDKKLKFIKMNYYNVIDKYGSDKPDLRNKSVLNKIVLKELKKWRLFFCKKKLFKFFSQKNKFIGRYIIFKEQISNNLYTKFKKYQFQYSDSVRIFFYELKTKKLFFWIDNNLEQIILDFEDPFVFYFLKKIKNNSLFLIGEKEITIFLSGLLRNLLIEEDILPKKEKFSFLWIKNWPFLIWNRKEKKYEVSHHPFTQVFYKQNNGLKKQIFARSYDLVLNGIEIASGSIRNHDYRQQLKIFKLLNYSDAKIKKDFSFFLEALQYGAPPHGGIAFGIDRLLMIFLNRESIKDFIAFPKNSKGDCLLTR